MKDSLNYKLEVLRIAIMIAAIIGSIFLFFGDMRTQVTVQARDLTSLQRDYETHKADQKTEYKDLSDKMDKLTEKLNNLAISQAHDRSERP